jgi:hypothetical protein
MAIFGTTPDNVIKELRQIKTRLPLLKLYLTADGNFIRTLANCTQSLVDKHQTQIQRTPEGQAMRCGPEITNAPKRFRDETLLPEHPKKKVKVEREV